MNVLTVSESIERMPAVWSVLLGQSGFPKSAKWMSPWGKRQFDGR